MHFESFTLLLSIVGAIAALIQWRESNNYKRAELVEALICKTRDDEDIAMIMDIIDWGLGLRYDGLFHIDNNGCSTSCERLSSEQLLIKIDKTLAHFSYICYLNSKRIIKKSDMVPFEYGLSRIASNKNIANFLYSIYHWSKNLNVNCSYKYFIEYALKKNHFDKEFLELNKSNTGKFICYLRF